VPIYLRITVNGKRSETTTGECEPSLWNSIAGRLKGTKEDTKSFNAYLDTLQKQVYEAHSQLTEAKSSITAETLRDRLLGKSEKTRILIDIFKDHNKKVATLVGKEYATGTSIRYQTSLKHTQEFLLRQYKVSTTSTLRGTEASRPT
jgi:site-specific recombinase